jgi:uncharacterized protein
VIVTNFPKATTLAARIWLPEDAEQDPVPKILDYLPYRERDGTYQRDALTHSCLADHDYAGVRVDIRGSGESTGLLFDEYAKQEEVHGRCLPAAGKLARLGGRERTVLSRLGSLYSSRFLVIDLNMACLM